MCLCFLMTILKKQRVSSVCVCVVQVKGGGVVVVR